MADSYLGISQAAASPTLQARVTACAAQQDAPGDPTQWTYDGRYTWAAAPGWGAAWDSAVAAESEDPGADPAVITDQMILSQVQSMLDTSGG